MSSTVEFRVNLESPFESLSDLGWGNSTGHRAYVLKRYLFPVARFMATSSQVKKIRSKKGVIQITRDQMQHYSHLASHWGK